MRKVALITGGAKRIGEATARLLHQFGYDLVLHFNQSTQQAEQLAKELNTSRPDSVYLFKADLQFLDGGVSALAEFALTIEGGIDVLINNASVFYPRAVGEVSERDWDELFSVNLKAPFFLAQALLPALRLRQGCVVNIVDIHAERGLKDFPVYSIAKAGLVALTKCLAKELAPEIRVNAVAPGAILWPDQPLDDEEKNTVLQKVALQRCGTVEDIANAVRFLIEDADYITGHILTVDGGRMLFS